MEDEEIFSFLVCGEERGREGGSHKVTKIKAGWRLNPYPVAELPESQVLGKARLHTHTVFVIDFAALMATFTSS